MDMISIMDSKSKHGFDVYPYYIHVVGYVEGAIPGEEVFRFTRSYRVDYYTRSWRGVNNDLILHCLNETRDYIAAAKQDPSNSVIVAVIDNHGNDLLEGCASSVYLQDLMETYSKAV